MDAGTKIFPRKPFMGINTSSEKNCVLSVRGGGRPTQKSVNRVFGLRIFRDNASSLFPPNGAYRLDSTEGPVFELTIALHSTLHLSGFVFLDF